MLTTPLVVLLCLMLAVISHHGIHGGRIPPNLTTDLYEMFQDVNEKIKKLDCNAVTKKTCDRDKDAKIMLKKQIGAFTITICCEAGDIIPKPGPVD